MDSFSCPARHHHHGPSLEGSGICSCPGGCWTGNLLWHPEPTTRRGQSHAHRWGGHSPSAFCRPFSLPIPGSLSQPWAVPTATRIRADTVNWTHRRFLELVFSSSDVGTAICIGSLWLPQELNKLNSLKARLLWQLGTGSLNENAVYFLILVFYTSNFISRKQFIVQTPFELFLLISDSVNRVVDYKIWVLFIRLFQLQTLIQSRTGLRSHSKDLITKIAFS